MNIEPHVLFIILLGVFNAIQLYLVRQATIAFKEESKNNRQAIMEMQANQVKTQIETEGHKATSKSEHRTIIETGRDIKAEIKDLREDVRDLPGKMVST